MKLLLFGFVLSGVPLIAQRLELNNTSNSALNDPVYGADFVAGDNFEVVISGATATSAVTLTESVNGNLINNQAYIGQTDGNGDFTLTGTESAAFVGYYDESWYVGGTQVGGALSFQVLAVPTSLSVASVSLANPDCSSTLPYGIQIDIWYNVLSQAGQNIQSELIPMIPYEEGQFYENGNVPGNTFSGNVGPVPGYPDSSEWVALDGTFHDVPVGGCSNGTFSNAGATQALYIQIGNNTYPVRATTRFYLSSSGSGHGLITNNNDVTKSR